jgi:hypothetical protein
LRAGPGVWLWLLAASAWAASDLVSPIGAQAEPPAPWHVTGMPHQRKPFTRFTVEDFDGRRTLRVESDHAYGNLAHPLHDLRAGTLAWSWRVDQPIVGADLTRKSGDDAALKVCAAFDMPIARVPFFERQLLRLVSTQTAEPVPAATLCYVLDTSSLPGNTLLHNAFTHRIRFIVVHASPGQWSDERHDLAADFLRAFGDESSEVPPLAGIAIGADSDNTGSHSVAHLEALRLMPEP